MGIMKQMLMEQAEEERLEAFREWFSDKFGRKPSKKDEAKYWDDFEIDEAFEHAMSKDD